MNAQSLSDDQLTLALTNLGKLVGEMAKEARDQGATTMHEWSLQNALARICPLFPFC